MPQWCPLACRDGQQRGAANVTGGAAKEKYCGEGDSEREGHATELGTVCAGGNGEGRPPGWPGRKGMVGPQLQRRASRNTCLPPVTHSSTPSSLERQRGTNVGALGCK